MARIDPLLKMIAAQGGTEMRIAASERPQLFNGSSPLRLFLPAMADPLLRGMVEPLVAPADWSAFLDGEPVRFEHAHPDHGAFSVEAGLRDGRTRMRIQRAAAATPEPPAAAPVVSAPTGGLEVILAQAVARGASDVHLAEGEPVTFRVDGRLLATGAPLAVEGILAELITAERRARLETGVAVDLAVEVAGQGRFRGNVYPHSGGLAAAFRVLTRAAPSLQSLELPVDLTPVVDSAHGLVIVCGPTGSGKSTTLAALGRHVLEQRGGLLISLEDPIEYTFSATRGSLVRQRQIGEHARDFQTGLRDALREDPDILLVGEMRDRESIELALTAAETGHLVLTTLHSRSTAGAIDRIVDVFPDARHGQVRQQLADALRAVVAQRLIPRSRGEGRVPAVEVLRTSHGVRALIREGRTSGLTSALQAGGADGMIQLERCLADQVRRGQFSPQAAEAAANDRTALRDFLR